MTLILARNAVSAEITILYWGDRFARDFPVRRSESDTTLIGGAAQLATMVNMYRTYPDVFLLVAGGDLAGTLAAMKTEGVAPAKILGRIKPDVYSPGVVDFTLGAEKLGKALKLGKIKAILSNAFNEDSGHYLPPDTVLGDGSVSMGIAALVPSRLPELVPRDGILNLTVTDPIRTAKEFVKAHGERCDMLVLLSQLGWETDSLLAVAVPEIDLIIEGHSRVAFEKPLKVGKTIVVSSGAEGRFLGKVRFEVSIESHKIELIDNELLPVESGVLKPDRFVKQKLVELEKRYTNMRGKKVAKLLTNWNVNPTGESNLSQWAADAMRQTANSAKLAVVNNLDFEQGVERGNLHEFDLFNILPFDVPLIAFQIKGWELRRVIELQASGKIPFLTWSGLRATIEGGKVASIEIEREGELVDESEYAIITNGLLWDRFRSEIGLVPEVRPIFIFPTTHRKVMVESVKKQKAISTPLDRRWIVR